MPALLPQFPAPVGLIGEAAPVIDMHLKSQLVALTAAAVTSTTLPFSQFSEERKTLVVTLALETLSVPFTVMLFLT
jgi:hypothetical protein